MPSSGVKVLLGALERVPPLLVRLEPQRREPAAGVADRHRVGEIGQRAAPRAVADEIAGDQPRASEASSRRNRSLVCRRGEVRTEDQCGLLTPMVVRAVVRFLDVVTSPVSTPSSASAPACL
jgi:hypothetical protein